MATLDKLDQIRFNVYMNITEMCILRQVINAGVLLAVLFFPSIGSTQLPQGIAVPSLERAGYIQANVSALTVDLEGNVFYAGRLDDPTSQPAPVGSLDIDPGPATVPVPVQEAITYVAKASADLEMEWVHFVGNLPWGVTVIDHLTTDAEGNLFISGNFGTKGDPISFGEPNNIVTIDPLDTEWNRIVPFLWKLGPDGTTNWVRAFDSATATVLPLPSLWVNHCMIGSDGSLYLTGAIHRTYDLDPGPGIANFTSVHLNVSQTTNVHNPVIIKLGSEGEFVWGRLFAGPRDGNCMLIEDAEGALFTVVSYRNTLDADPGEAELIFTDSADERAMAFVKLDENGDLVSATNFGGGTSLIRSALKLDSSGGIVLAGHYEAAFDADPSGGTVLLPEPTGFNDFFLMRLTSGGNLDWAQPLPDGVTVWSLQVGGDNDFYIHGTALAGSFLGTGADDIGALGPTVCAFIARWELANKHLWSFPIPNNDTADIAHSESAGFEVAYAHTGHVYLRFNGDGALDFDPSSNSNAPSSFTDLADTYIVQYGTDDTTHVRIQDTIPQHPITGHSISPQRRLANAVRAALPGQDIILMGSGGDSDETLTISKPVRILPTGGTVRVGVQQP